MKVFDIENVLGSLGNTIYFSTFTALIYNRTFRYGFVFIMLFCFRFRNKFEIVLIAGVNTRCHLFYCNIWPYGFLSFIPLYVVCILNIHYLNFHVLFLFQRQRVKPKLASPHGVSIAS